MLLQKTPKLPEKSEFVDRQLVCNFHSRPVTRLVDSLLKQLSSSLLYFIFAAPIAGKRLESPVDDWLLEEILVETFREHEALCYQVDRFELGYQAWFWKSEDPGGVWEQLNNLLHDLAVELSGGFWIQTPKDVVHKNDCRALQEYAAKHELQFICCFHPVRNIAIKRPAQPLVTEPFERESCLLFSQALITVVASLQVFKDSNSFNDGVACKIEDLWRSPLLQRFSAHSHGSSVVGPEAAEDFADCG